MAEQVEYTNWDAADRADAVRQVVDQPDVVEALNRGMGLGEYLSAGPELIDRLEAGSPPAGGVAVVRAAADWYRAGRGRTPVARRRRRRPRRAMANLDAYRARTARTVDASRKSQHLESFAAANLHLSPVPAPSFAPDAGTGQVRPGRGGGTGTCRPPRTTGRCGGRPGSRATSSPRRRTRRTTRTRTNGRRARRPTAAGTGPAR